MNKQSMILSKEPMLHIGGWAAVLIINYTMMDGTTILHDIKMTYLSWVCYIVLFYVNYLLFIPKLLFRKRIWSYILASLFTIGIMFVGLRTESIFQYKRFHQEMLSKEISLAPQRRTPPPISPEDIRKRISSSYSLKQYSPFSRKRNQQQIYGLLLIFSISMLMRFFGRWREEEHRQIELEKEKISSELDYLKKQINPHFLFNALNSIYSLTLPYEDNRASESILKLSSILRYMLYETDQRKVPLASEIDILYNYIGLQRLRLTNKTTVSFNIDGDIEGYGIEPLLLIPFIENAFKYGVDSAEPSSIDISIRIENSSIYFDVKNKIVANNKRSSHSGIGIKNIERRLEILYPESHKLKISEHEGVFFVSLIIPLKNI